MNYLLAIDAGTGSGRAVLFDTEGNQIAIGQEEWSHIAEAGVPGSMGFDCAANWPLLCRCIQKAIAGIDPSKILAVSATSMREGIVVYDKNGQELWAVANVDGRACAEVVALKKQFPALEKEQYEASGQTFALAALPRLLWLKNHQPKLYEAADKLSMISDWVLFKLSGEIAVDPSNGGTTGLLSLKTRSWLPELAQKAGIKSALLPRVAETGSVIGKVTEAAAKACGLKAGTPVVMGGGDVQLGSAGLGVVKPGQSAVLGGTFWQQLVNVQGALLDPNMDLRINPHVIAGQSQAEGITFFTGLVMRWFRDALCQSEVAEARARGIDPYALLEEMAAKAPAGANGVLPIFSDEMHYGRWIHAAPSFINLSIDPARCGKAEMFRALQENAAIVSGINLQKVEKLTGTASGEVVFAGGASKGKLWSQILADVTGKQVKVPVVKEATALACAFAAGVGAGIWRNLEEPGELIKWETRYDPDTKNHALYGEVTARWQAVYAAQLKLAEAGLTNSLWRAPGV